MSKSTGAYGVTARDKQKSSRRHGSHNVVGGAALALIALGLAWTTYSGFTGNSHDAGPRVARVGPVDTRAKTERTSFADRFEPVETASPAPPQKRNVYVALLDPTYSLSSTPDTFSTNPRPKYEPRLIAEAAAEGDAPEPNQVQASVPPARLPLPVINEKLALSIPKPSPRPTEVQALQRAGAYSHEMLVRKAKAALLASAASGKASIFEKLFGKPDGAGALLAYAPSDGGVTGDGRDPSPGGPSLHDRSTAVYDISARKVYMPDGTRLEAHSGLGSRLDNPKFAHEKMRGVTPPHIYDLKMREALFHGVAAIRLTPIGGEGAIFGRNGLLAHTYMLGPNGDSNGCVSFKNYDAFLQAYKSQRVTRLVVVATLD